MAAVGAEQTRNALFLFSTVFWSAVERDDYPVDFFYEKETKRPNHRHKKLLAFLTVQGSLLIEKQMSHSVISARVIVS